MVTQISEQSLHFLWLEITGRCQLECVHCYAESGPNGTHGSMSRDDWETVIKDAAELGTSTVQFIGGEPTLHPAFPSLLEFAFEHDLNIEVFTNLVYINPSLWDMFAQFKVSLATSFYSVDENEHAAITNRRSFHSTRDGIVEAVRREIPLRVGMIGVHEQQQVDQARQLLIELGVEEQKIGYDDLRQVGRGVRDAKPGPDQLCGNCADGVLAISPTGDVWPCVFTRWMPLGNVQQQSLSDLMKIQVLDQARGELEKYFIQSGTWPCEPECSPRCSPSCSPCSPGNRCWPYYD